MARSNLVRHPARQLALSLGALTVSAGALVCLGTPAAAARTRTAASGGYLLAVGDSLAAGYQPTDGHRAPPIDPATGLRDAGYPGGYAADVASAEHLQLVDLGCPGETTSSYATKPAQAACATGYKQMTGTTTQRAAVLAEIAAHPGQIRLVTFDLGANDLDACLRGGTVSPACLATTAAQLSSHIPGVLKTITTALQQSDPGTPVVAMTYYDPYLARAYAPGGIVGDAEAALSLGAAKGFNASLTTAYRRAHVRVANVGAAFQMTDVLPLTTYGGKRLPRNVARVCQWTWMCPLPARATGTPGLNIHPNDAGYARIAGAFLAALKR